MKMQKTQKKVFLQVYGSFLHDLLNRKLVKKFNLNPNMVGYNKLLLYMSEVFANDTSNINAEYNNFTGIIEILGQFLLNQTNTVFLDKSGNCYKVKGLSDEDIVKTDLLLAKGYSFPKIYETYSGDVEYESIDKSEIVWIDRPGFVIPTSLLDVNYESMYNYIKGDIVFFKSCVNIGLEEELFFTLN